MREPRRVARRMVAHGRRRGLDKHAFSRTVRSLFPSTRQHHLTPSELILTGLGLTPESYRLL